MLQKVRVPKKFTDKGEGGSIKIFRRLFFVSQCWKNRNGTLSCLTISGYRKMLGINRKDISVDRYSNPEPTAWEPCSPNTSAVIYFWTKRVGNFALKKNGWLVPVKFSPNYKQFDQLLQTVKNKTTILNLVLKSLYKHQFHHWFLYFMQKGFTVVRW